MKKRLFTSLAAAVMLASAALPATNMMVNTPARSQRADAATAIERSFLKKAAKQAVVAAKKYGTFPSVMMAQAIVESDWGQSGLAVNANNLFGMKADDNWNGATYTSRTREESASGSSYYINAKFRKYPSFEVSFEDNGKKLREGVSWQPLRYKGAWIENADNYANATRALTGTYATDHNYASALDSRITRFNLSKYDPVVSKNAKVYTVSKSGSTYNWPTSPSIAHVTGSVKAGDKVAVSKTITFHDGSTRMYVNGKGWINGTYLGHGTNSSPITQAPQGAMKSQKNLMHNAYVYNKNGKRIKGKSFKINNDDGFKLINTYGSRKIKGKKYYQVGKNAFIAAGNIDGQMRLLKHNACVYNQYGNRDNNVKHKKNESIATYGSAVTIEGKKYYRIGIRQYIKKSNFASLSK